MESATASLKLESMVLRRFARSLVSPEDAEDAVQDAMLKAVAAPQTPRARAPWLKQVIRNALRGRARRGMAWERAQVRLGPDAAQTSPSEALEAAELAEAISDALQALAEPFREVVVQRFYGDCTTREIAASLERPHGTVRWQLHEGLRRMRSSLDKTFDTRRSWAGAAAAIGGVPTATTPVPFSPPNTPTPMMHFTLPLVAATGFFVAALSTSTSSPAPLSSSSSSPNSSSSSNRATPTEASVAAVATPAQRATPMLTRDRVGTAPEAPLDEDSSPKAAPEDETDASEATFDFEQCAVREISAYNSVSDSDPNADEHLVDAAECFESAGILGKAMIVHVVVGRKFPDGPNAEVSAAAVRRIAGTTLDAKRSLETPLGRACMAPIEDEKGRVEASEYVAAAECLERGQLLAAAIKARTEAPKHGSEFDAEANAAAIEVDQKQAALHEKFARGKK